MKKLRVFCLGVACVAGLGISQAYAGGADAIRMAERGQWGAALNQAGGGIAADVVKWMYLLDGDTRASFSEIAAFVTKHPDWPDNKKLFKIAESRLPNDVSDNQILNWFAVNAPVSAAGMKRYMGALLDTRQTALAVNSLKTWWVDADLSVADQEEMINSFSSYFSTADHIRRLEKILTDKQYGQARALAAHIGRGYQQLVAARQALQEGTRGIEASVSAVPNSLLKDAGLLLSRVQYRREKDMDDEAIQLLNMAPPAGQTTDPAAWWKERHVLARRMMERGNYRAAYQLASHHGLPAAGADFAAAEFLSGWLALRFINQPYKAFEHFEKLYNNAETPITRARAAYWAGRASEALNGRDIALQWYQTAAKYQTTFYGQEAAKRIGLPLNLIKGNKPPVSDIQQAAFNSRTLVQAIKLFHRAGMGPERTKFYKALLESAASPQDYSMISDLAVSMGQVDMALKVAKDAERKADLYLIDYLFPTIMHTMGDYGVDKALVHALIRQESQFDANAVSPSGALGLMQVMPATAKMTAKRNDLMHNTSLLTANPRHNVQIGSLYIREMLDRFDGNLPMAIAAYNAGPGRVQQWAKEFGDPRSPNVDTIDWMESIPIYETRNYVQRVMEGYAVYRMKLARYQGDTDSPRAHSLGRIETAYNP
ncbi:MAG: lytic transglycosylase domain-containing protein [Alphaproteobacteria bacterium]|nr:lytic transglycosylase domain-containing protein [Alphaproteobacteria bacterium]